ARGARQAVNFVGQLQKFFLHSTMPLFHNRSNSEYLEVISGLERQALSSNSTASSKVSACKESLLASSTISSRFLRSSTDLTPGWGRLSNRRSNSLALAGRFSKSWAKEA